MEERSTSWTASSKNPGYCESVIERFFRDQLLVVLSPRKRVDEMISEFPLEDLTLDEDSIRPMLTLAMLNDRSFVTLDRVEVPETTSQSPKAVVVLVVEGLGFSRGLKCLRTHEDVG